MDVKKKYKKELKKMIQNDTTDINKIDDLILLTIDNCRQELLKCTEDILTNNIKENKLIIKKNKSGKKEELN